MYLISLLIGSLYANELEFPLTLSQQHLRTLQAYVSCENVKYFLQQARILSFLYLDLQHNMRVWVIVKTSFTLEVTLMKSGVENVWDLASLYVMCTCLSCMVLYFGVDQRWVIETCHVK